jgi:hypothetical protein
MAMCLWQRLPPPVRGRGRRYTRWRWRWRTRGRSSLVLPILPLLSALLPVCSSLVVIPGVIAVLALVGSISSIARIIPSIGGAIWINITPGDGAEDAEAQEGEEYLFHYVYSFRVSMHTHREGSKNHAMFPSRSPQCRLASQRAHC